MKLAEALILRADYQRRIEQLKQRVLRVSKVQEGDAPAEDPADLLVQIETVSQDLERIIQQINLTNTSTELSPGVSIADAIATRDMLRLKHSLYRELAQAATISQARNTRSEVKFISSLNVSDMQRQADDYAREQRELDARLQEANWLTELL